MIVETPSWAIVPDMPDDIYHGMSSLSSSQLKRFIKSPMHYRTPPQDDDSAALRFGRLVHGLALEPEKFFARYPVVDASTRNTKVYKEAAEKSTRDVYLQSEVDLATDIAVAARADEYAAPLMDNAEFETSLFWTEQSREARARLDIWQRDTGIVADLKTCEDASPQAFLRSVIKYGYYISAEWYRRGVESCGQPFLEWYWIAVEKKPPHAVQVYRADPAWFDFAAARIDVALRYMAECEAADNWPSYADGIFNLALPAWAGID